MLLHKVKLMKHFQTNAYLESITFSFNVFNKNEVNIEGRYVISTIHHKINIFLLFWFPVESSDCDKLKEAYNQCVKAVVDFRSYHIQIVTK